MTAAHRRGAEREQQAADMLGAKRTKNRSRFVSMPDIEAIRFGDGTLVQPEVATRAKLPALVLTKIAQAERYTPGAIPLVILSQKGGQPYAVLPLARFAELVGLRAPKDGAQLSLLVGRLP